MKSCKLSSSLILAMLVSGSMLLSVQASDSPPAAKSTKKASKSKKKKSKSQKKGSKAAKASAEVSALAIPAEAWAEPEKLRSELADKIISLISTPDEKSLRSFLKSPENRILLAQWMLVDAVVKSESAAQEYKSKAESELTKAECELNKIKQAIEDGDKSEKTAARLARVEKRYKERKDEAESAILLAEALKADGGAELMAAITSDPVWLNQFVYSGECERVGVALSILLKIKEKYPELLDNSLHRDIATATALEFARSGWLQCKAVERAAFFIDNYEKGRLNIVFDDLPFWQRRMVCGCKGDNEFGSVKSLQWSLDNVHLPVDQYAGTFWRCGYKLYNLFGMSIHGDAYYAPFDDIYGENKTGATFHVGGVCGSLSHFGAFSALAHGIPALTSGEPGHCSFIVLIGDKWTPGNSLSWERGCHWQAWKGVHVFSHLHMASAMYDDKKESSLLTLYSQSWRTLAGVYAVAHPEQALDSYAAAVKTQPCNYAAWREYAEYLKASEAQTDAWLAFNKAVCSYLVPRFPEMASELLRKHAYPAMITALPEAELRSCMVDFWKALKVLGPERWHVDDMANAQVDALGIKQNGEALSTFYADILRGASSGAQYMPLLMSWGNEIAKELGDDAGALFMDAMIKGISSDTSLSGDARDKAIGSAILAAASMYDIESFQSLSKLASSKKSKKERMPSIKSFSGKLMSEGGVVRTSSTCSADNPCAHAGLLTRAGGSCYTDKTEKAWVAVGMPRLANLTGVVIVPSAGKLGKVKQIAVEVSETGNDGDWQEVAVITSFEDSALAVDLKDSLPAARFVRFVRTGDKSHFSLRGIYVYGKPAS